jgi:hypothetical protein
MTKTKFSILLIQLLQRGHGLLTGLLLFLLTKEQQALNQAVTGLQPFSC